jgi:Na+-transporting methylmalonyl-CoA/oxaloacetate decarboxylase gamma subunit
MSCSCSKKKPLDRFFMLGVIMLIVTIALILISLIWIPINTDAGKNDNWGWAVGVWYWWDSFAIDLVQGKTQWVSENELSWLLVSVTLASLVMTILLLILYIRQKAKKGAIASVLAFVTILVLGIVYSTMAWGLKLGVCQRRQYDLLWIIEGCGIVALIFLVLAASVPFLSQTFAAVAKEAEPAEEKKEESRLKKPNLSKRKKKSRNLLRKRKKKNRKKSRLPLLNLNPLLS